MNIRDRLPPATQSLLYSIHDSHRDSSDGVELQSSPRRRQIAPPRVTPLTPALRWRRNSRYPSVVRRSSP